MYLDYSFERIVRLIYILVYIRCSSAGSLVLMSFRCREKHRKQQCVWVWNGNKKKSYGSLANGKQTLAIESIDDFQRQSYSNKQYCFVCVHIADWDLEINTSCFIW